MALPTAVRNRLAALILEALWDANARQALASLAAAGDAPLARDVDAPGSDDAAPSSGQESSPGHDLRAAMTAHGAAIAERARRAWLAVAPGALESRDAGLEAALGQAGALFDAALYFEVHELLEPHWMASSGETRITLQGLIQVAVGFEHLANGNERGARALLREGSAKVAAGDPLGRDMRPFVRAVRECADLIGRGPGAVADVKAPRFPSKD